MAFSTFLNVLVHISKMLGKTNHLGAFICALFDQTLAFLIVSVYILCGTHLNQSHDASKVVLLR